MISDQEKAERLFDVNSSLASQRLAGLEVDEETRADLFSYASGELELGTARQRALDRISKEANSGTSTGS